MICGNDLKTELQAWMPVVEIQQRNGTLVVSAELPGIKKEDVEVTVSDDGLVIEGDGKQEHSEDHESGYHRKQRFGRFYWSISLPQGARADAVKAELKDGVLKVSIPIPETARKPRQVPVTG